MSILGTNQRLLDLIDDARLMADEPAPPDNHGQVQALIYAERLATMARDIVKNYQTALSTNRERGDMIETPAGIVQVTENRNPRKWKHAELRADARPKVLETPDGVRRSPEEVLDFLWDEETGLHPLNGSMRMKQFRRMGFDIDEYAETTPTKSVRVLSETKDQ